MGETVRDLLVWQRAIALAVCIHELTRGFPQEELYGLTGHTRRTSISIASNIAEGRARASGSEFRYYLRLAQDAVFELKTQLVIAEQLGMGDSKALSFAGSLCEDVAKGLASLQKTVCTPQALNPACVLSSQTERLTAQA